jgi:hypothetical protein
MPTTISRRDCAAPNPRKETRMAKKLHNKVEPDYDALFDVMKSNERLTNTYNDDAWKLVEKTLPRSDPNPPKRRGHR